MDENIIKFITRHHVLSLATVDTAGAPYCAACFYAFDRERNCLIFASDRTTAHITHILANPTVACSILLETRIVGKVQGVQLRGTARLATDGAKFTYLKRFPYAAAMNLQLWEVEITFAKLTDNTLGFGNKTIWTKQQI